MAELRHSTLEEREEYYSNEFDLAKVEKWFSENKVKKAQIFAVDCGTETGIIKDKSKINKLIHLRPEGLKKKFVNYLPEDAYYDRNVYVDPELQLKIKNFTKSFGGPNVECQQLVFDIDPENMNCSCEKKFPNFCDRCIRKTVEKVIKLYEHLEDKFNKLRIVYSGRGMHLHVFDKSAFELTMKEREELNDTLKEFAIDPWVSRGRIRLVRLPYSLNGLVSRIVTPLTFDEVLEFDPVSSEKTVPNFLKN